MLKKFIDRHLVIFDWCLSATATTGLFDLGICCCQLNQTIDHSMAITRKALVTILKLNVPIV